MSRTDKDRPYRVVVNDRTLGRVEHHNHTPRRYWTPIRERGERVLVYGEHFWNLRFVDGTPGLTIEEDNEERCRANRPLVALRSGDKKWYYEPRAHYEWVGRTYHDAETSGECTIDEPEPYMGWRQNCYAAPPDHNIPWGAFGNNYYDDWEADPRYPNRRYVRDNTKRYVKEYNATGQVDDSVWR